MNAQSATATIKYHHEMRAYFGDKFHKQYAREDAYKYHGTWIRVLADALQNKRKHSENLLRLKREYPRQYAEFVKNV